MTTLLEKAIEKISALPEIEQNIYAKNLLDEIESEKRWEHLFSESEELLSEMAEKALKELKSGKTTLLKQEQL